MVDNKHDRVGHGENVEPDDDGVTELNTDLNKVLIDPPSGDNGETVVGGDGSCEMKNYQKMSRKRDERQTLSKDTSEDETDNTSHSVTGVNIHRIVKLEVSLEGRENVGEDGGDDTDEESTGSSDVSSFHAKARSAQRRENGNENEPAGVMATRPTIAPVQKPTADHLRSSR